MVGQARADSLQQELHAAREQQRAQRRRAEELEGLLASLRRDLDQERAACR